MTDDSLKKLKKRLYKKGEAFERRGERARIYGKKEKVPAAYWKTRPAKKTRPFRPLKIIFLLAGLFSLASISLLAYFFMGGGNIVSSRNIIMEIKGPQYVRGGETISFYIDIENRNSSAIETADIILDFPAGSFSGEGKEISRERYPLGSIGAGESVRKRIEFNLFGEEDEEKKISATLEYRLAQSNAIFAKTVDYTVMISKPAVGVSVSLPEDANAGQEIEIQVGVVSNSEAIIRNLVLKIDYPSGFQFTGSSPEPSGANNVWKIGDMDPSQERSVAVRGIVGGQDLEEKAFRVRVGFEKEEGVFLPYGTAVASFTVKKPFVDLILFVDGGDSAENIAFAGDSIRFDLAWKNNLSVNLRDASLEVKVRGGAQDGRSISVSEGFYRTFDKTLVWTPSSLPQLKLIAPGETGRARFSFSILNPLPVKGVSDKDFTVELEAKISGRAVMGGEESAEIINSVKKEIKIGSRPQLASMALHYSGPFKNSGPMPPRAGKETNYTIIWSLGNIVNDFSGVKVSAAIPAYARWTGNVSPPDADISFDEMNGEVVWNAGDVPAGTGIFKPAKEVAFQLALAPSMSQIGASPALTGKAILEARDNFINKIFKDEKNPLTTRLINDPKFSQNEAAVKE